MPSCLWLSDLHDDNHHNGEDHLNNAETPLHSPFLCLNNDWALPVRTFGHIRIPKQILAIPSRLWVSRGGPRVPLRPHSSWDHRVLLWQVLNRGGRKRASRRGHQRPLFGSVWHHVLLWDDNFPFRRELGLPTLWIVQQNLRLVQSTLALFYCSLLLVQRVPRQ